MSTGDQSEYLRRKMAERHTQYDQGGQFMKSGYQLWAENERPARQGGAMKEAGERESNKAGKDILDRVKSLGEDMFAKYYKGSARHHEGDSESESDEETGGRIGMGYSGNGSDLARRVGTEAGRAPARKLGNGMPNTNGMVEVPKKKRVYKKKATKEAKATGKGFKEGVDETVRTVSAIGDASKNGYDAYERGVRGDVMGAIRSTEGVYTSGQKAATHGKAAAEEFKKMGGRRRKAKVVVPPVVVPPVVVRPPGRGLLPSVGKGKMECVHHEEGEGTVVKKAKGKGMLAEHGADLIKMGEKEGGSKRSARAAIVKKIMKEKGLSLPAASSYVKANGLYKP